MGEIEGLWALTSLVMIGLWLTLFIVPFVAGYFANKWDAPGIFVIGLIAWVLAFAIWANVYQINESVARMFNAN